MKGVNTCEAVTAWCLAHIVPDNWEVFLSWGAAHLVCVCVHMCVCTCVCVQSCLILCDSMESSLLGLSIHGILQARILEWVSHSLFQGIFLTQGLNPGLLNCRPDSLPFEPWEKPNEVVQFSSVAQSCPTLCDPMGYSLPGFSVHGISQARILELVAISFSKTLFI